MRSYQKILLVIFTILFASSVIIANRPAQAAWPTTVLGDIQGAAKWVWERARIVVDKAQGALTTQLINRTLSTFMNKLAYDLASNLATGGPGKQPLFETKSFTKSIESAREAALGEFIGQLSKSSFEDLGFNLCDPSLEVKLSLTLSLIDSKAPAKPTCDWRKVQREWAKFGNNFTADLIKVQLDTQGGTKNLEDFFDKGFSYEQTDLGVFAKISEAARKKEEEAAKAKEALEKECKGYLAPEKTITQEKLASCSDIMDMTGAIIDQSVKTDTSKVTESGLKKEIGAIGTIMKTAGDLFINTFTSKLMHRWIKGGMWSVFGGKEASNSNLRTSLLAQLRGGKVSESQFLSVATDIQAIEINSLDSFSLFEDFAVCPEEAQYRKPDNCVMSNDFLQAISSKVTLKEAVDKGMIKGSLAFIGRDDGLRNANKECYKDALCYSNLVKLRKANIIPVGWEMAALNSTLDKPVTLQQAMDCFEDNNPNCIFPSTATEHNPYYHLVDPYWILKAPAAFCNAYVYSPMLEAPDTTNRQQYCADVQTCLREDSQGNCLAGQYGYCTKSENIWRFAGDACEDGEIYAGCLTFQNISNNSTASYLEQSLDYCSSDQVGCKRYSQTKNNDGDWILRDISLDGSDLFLNNKSASCPSDMAGCSEYIVMAADTGTNLVANGSLTATSTTSLYPQGWYRDNNLSLPSNGAYYDNVNGRVANGYTYGPGGYVGPLPGDVDDAKRFQQKIALLPNTTYAISASAARYDAATAVAARVSLLMCDRNGDCNSSNDPTNTNPAGPVPGVGLVDGKCVIANKNSFDLRFTPSGTEMERESCTFTTNSYTYGTLLNLLTNGTPNLIWFDDIKLEIVSNVNKTATAYSEYGIGSKVYMNGTRFMCTQDEVGCQGYTPSNGDPMVPAVISQEDLCPNECVGYSTFAEEPDHFDITENPAATYTYYNFIPSTAKSCPATYAGCEEFTNVDAVAQGGEGREYYTYLRQCVSPETTGVVDYFTWEGSEVAGYQIVPLKALSSTVLYTGELAGNPPCTNINPGDSTCNDAVATIAACGDSTPSGLDDPEVNANCREIFDSSGNSFYRLYDRIIFASNDCHDYRRTANNRIYRAIPSLSKQCPSSQNGCRAYYGNTANNVRNVFTDDFERQAFAPWTPISAGLTLSLSSESLERDGHSLKIGGIGSTTAVPINPIENDKQYKLSWWMKSSVSMGTEAQPGAFWYLEADGLGGGPAGIALLSTPGDSALQIIPGNNWNYYTITQNVTSLDPTRYNLNSVRLRFVSTRNAANENGDIYLDNVLFKEVAGNVYVVRNSWQTPASCDAPYLGYHLGCQTYTDTNRVKYNLRSFHNLCRQEAIGCMAVIDTHNSNSPFLERFHYSEPPAPSDYSRIDVPADSIAYLVPDSRKYCPAAYKGCQALGLPDRTNPNYLPTVYKINDPNQYEQSLCYSEDLYCEEFSSDKGAYYFKDPGNTNCTYRTNVAVGNRVVTGWFKTANMNDPLPLGCLDTNNRYDDGDFELGLNAATCPSSKNLCTAYYDPTDPVGCDSVGTCELCVAGVCSAVPIEDARECRGVGYTYTPPTCQAYYFYNNDKIDQASCNGQVNKNDGCVLFKDANNWNGDHTVLNLSYDSTQSYAQNIANARAVSPVTCDPDTDPACNLDTNILVKVTKDRQCGEWLACRSSSVVWDKDNNKYKVVCSDLGVCKQFDSSNNITRCAEWATPEQEALTISNYQDRGTGFNGNMQFGDQDYTGYSIPDMLPISSLMVANVGTTAQPNSQLVYNTNQPCSGSGVCSVNYNGADFSGICRVVDGSSVCLVNPLAGSNTTFNVQTRGYAQTDSPFPASISPDTGRIDRIQAYSGANMCEEDQIDPITPSPNGCELVYIKTTYGSGGEVRYYPKGIASPGGICTSGNTDSNIDCVDSAGKAQNSLCDTINNDGTSRSDGVCDKKIKAETIYNWPGICLEYDYSAKVINDTGGTNYCNQWYPAEQISGTNSLYDNYREAGYYDPSGRQALFCSLTKEFVTTDDRVYCIDRGDSDPQNCDALAFVPKGSKIKNSSIANNGSIISYGFLKPDSYNYVPADVVGDSRNPGFDIGIGLDRLEKNGLSTAGYYDSKFSTADFVLADNATINSVPVTSANVLGNIFVPPQPPVGVSWPEASTTISLFYLDEDVNNDQQPSHPNCRIWIGDRFNRSNDPRGTVGCMGQDASNPGPEDSGNDCSTCPTDLGQTWHGVVPGYCNPLGYNYYVKPEVRNAFEDFDCSESIPKGAACMNAQPTFTGITATPPCIANDYNCLFKQCVLGVPAAAAGTHFDSKIWCSDYGSIEYGTESYYGVLDIDSLTGCTSYLFATSTASGGVNGLIKRSSAISDQLIREAYGSFTTRTLRGTTFYILGSVNNGCLESDIGAGNIDSGIGIFDYSSGCRYVFLDGFSSRTFVCNESFSYKNPGASCSGMDCYQQCQYIAQLDPDGDLSWVRTDIWWRNETFGESGRENYPSTAFNLDWSWASWYYKAGFIQNDNVYYSGISGENVSFTHFGAALGFLAKDVVNVRVPFNASSFSALSAATFFARPENATEDPAIGLGRAHAHLAYLFYRVYNLVWDPSNSAYRPANLAADYDGEEIYRGNFVIDNAYNINAGRDYDPVLLRVCNDGACLDAGGQPIPGITVNNQQTGNVETAADQNSLYASIKFYYYAHPDHMPIKNIIIDWGDGSSNSSMPGKYQNNIPDCDPESTMPGRTTGKQGFGGTDRACREAYKTFYHDYQYNNAYDCATLGVAGYAAGEAACYKPEVSIVDHWDSNIERHIGTESFAGWIVVRRQ